MRKPCKAWRECRDGWILDLGPYVCRVNRRSRFDKAPGRYVCGIDNRNEGYAAGDDNVALMLSIEDTARTLLVAALAALDGEP